MDYFTVLIVKILPLYALISLGYIAGKFLNANRETVANLLFYIIAPLIIFNGVINTRIDTSVLLLPVVTFCISTFLCLVFYAGSLKIWKDSSRNLLGFSAGTGNTGYFGLPLALLLFNDQGEGVYIMALLGMSLYENSIGYYILAKGTHTARECLIKLTKLPALYAFGFGLLLNLLHIKMPSPFVEFIGYMKGAYTVLGMMVIGLGLASLQHFKVDFRFLGMSFLAKFVAWPIITLIIIYLDNNYFGFFGRSIYNALILISIVPLAVNTVILASVFKSQPEKAAMSVVLSILFALLYVPVMANYFIQVEPQSISQTELEQFVLGEKFEVPAD